VKSVVAVRPWLVGAVGLAIAVAVVLRILVSYDMDPTAYVAFFRDDTPAQIAYPSEVLGRPVVADGLAHDGKYFFAQANDPWYLDPERHAAVLDAPLYRAQRMLYPTIAGGFGLFPPEVILWSTIVINVLAMAIGTVLAARLALIWGYSPWLGIWVPLNIGLLLELNLGNAGVLAYTLCLAALLALEAKQTWLTALLFAAAALTREVMILFPVGLLILWMIQRRRPPWRLVLVPAAAMGIWHVYLRVRLSGIDGSGVGAGTKPLAPPFVDLIQGIRYWMRDPTHLAINLLILAMVAMFVPLALRSRLPIVWGALPFVALAGVVSFMVWKETYDFPRAFAPVFTAIPFVVATSAQRTPEEVSEEGMPIPGPRGDPSSLTAAGPSA
jgi:hypothetical protein